MKNTSSEEKRAMILTLASVMIESKGYEQFKIADLAREASVSIATLYALFDSKEGLYAACVRYKLEVMMASVRRQATEGAAERLRCFIVHVFHIANEGKLVLSQGMKNNPLFFNAHNNEFFETIEEIRRFLSDCFKELNPDIDEERARRLAYGFSGHIHGYMQYWLEGDMPLDMWIDEACESYVCLSRHCNSAQGGQS